MFNTQTSYPQYDGVIEVTVNVNATAKEFAFETVKSLDDKLIVGIAHNGRARFDSKGNPCVGTTSATAANNCWLYLAQPNQRRPVEGLPLFLLDPYQQACGVFPLPDLSIDWKQSRLVNHNSAADFAAGQVLVLTVFYRNRQPAKR